MDAVTSDADYLARSLSEPTAFEPIFDRHFGAVHRYLHHAQAWNAGLVGFVTRPGEAKQRVVITMKGRPKGVFVLTPLQPGFVKRDSGSHDYAGATG